MTTRPLFRCVYRKNSSTVDGIRTRARCTAALDDGRVDWEAAQAFNKIPGPEPVPLIGSEWHFLPLIGKYANLNRLSQQKQLQKEFGDIVHVGNRTVMLFDPKLFETIFRNEGPWPIRRGFGPIHFYRKVLRRNRFCSLAGTLSTQGKEWQSFRSKVNQPMMQPRSALRYVQPVNEVANDFIERMDGLRDPNNKLPAEFLNELYKWSLESLTQVTLGTRLGCLDRDLRPDSEPQKVIDSILTVMDEIFMLESSVLPWELLGAFYRFLKAMDYFSEVMEKHIAAAAAAGKEAGSEPSILQRLLQGGDERVARVMAADVLLGSVDTTSHTTAAMLFHLAKNSEKQRALREEIFRIMPLSHRQPLTSEDFTKMAYLKACLRETLRLFPVIPENIRTVPRDIVVGGYRLPKGTNVVMCHMVASRDERFFEQAATFAPERWLKGHKAQGKEAPFASLPFGFGPRTCVGRRFAELEIYTLVAKVCRQFSVKFPEIEELDYEARSINFISTPLQFQLVD